MTLEVIWGSGSPFAWRVLLTLEVKGLGYELRLIQFSREEQRSPEHLALNPRGKVPVLRDGDYVLSESLAIMAYLDRKHPEPPLFGRSAEEKGLIWKAISECDNYSVPACPSDCRARVRRRAARRGGRAGGGGGAAWRARPHGAGRVGKRMARRRAAQRRRPRGLSVRRGALRAADKEAVRPLGLGFLPLAQRYRRSRTGASASRPCPAARGPIRRIGAKRPEAGWSPGAMAQEPPTPRDTADGAAAAIAAAGLARARTAYANPAIAPFTYHAPQSALDDLRQRLAQARWPERETVADWSQGVPLAKLRALVEYWRTDYDWRRCEAVLNGLDQYRTEIDGLDIHFLHVRSPHADALPIIITHGWPGRSSSSSRSSVH